MKATKPVAQLTDQERAVIAINAGVPFEFANRTADSVSLVVEPCDITIKDGKYVVIYKKTK